MSPYDASPYDKSSCDNGIPLAMYCVLRYLAVDMRLSRHSFWLLIWPAPHLTHGCLAMPNFCYRSLTRTMHHRRHNARMVADGRTIWSVLHHFSFRQLPWFLASRRAVVQALAQLSLRRQIDRETPISLHRRQTWTRTYHNIFFCISNKTRTIAALASEIIWLVRRTDKSFAIQFWHVISCSSLFACVN